MMILCILYCCIALSKTPSNVTSRIKFDCHPMKHADVICSTILKYKKKKTCLSAFLFQSFLYFQSRSAFTRPCKSGSSENQHLSKGVDVFLEQPSGLLLCYIYRDRKESKLDIGGGETSVVNGPCKGQLGKNYFFLMN